MDYSKYITLNCKVSNDSDEVNNLANFTTKLSEEIKLDGEWEIGLSEISFPKMWSTLPCDQYLDILYFSSEAQNYFKIIRSDDFKIDKGEYSITELIEKCNSIIDLAFEDINGEIFLKGISSKKPVTKRPFISQWEDDGYIYAAQGMFNKNEYFYVRFDKILGNILGLDKHAITNMAFLEFQSYSKQLATQHFLNDLNYEPYSYPRFRAWRSPNLTRNIKYIYVSSDLIKNNFYRNKNTNLLRIVDIPENKDYGEQINTIFTKVYYFPLRKNKFDKIKIDIYLNDSEANAHVPFNFGEVFVVLHLKKVENELQNFRNFTPNIKPIIENQPKNTETNSSSHPFETKIISN